MIRVTQYEVIYVRVWAVFGRLCCRAPPDVPPDVPLLA